MPFRAPTFSVITIPLDDLGFLYHFEDEEVEILNKKSFSLHPHYTPKPSHHTPLYLSIASLFHVRSLQIPLTLKFFVSLGGPNTMPCVEKVSVSSY